MKYALVIDDRVHEIIETDQDITELYHPDMDWRDVTMVPNIAPGWLVLSQGSYMRPPPRVLTEQEEAQAILNGGVEVVCDSDESLNGKYEVTGDAQRMMMAEVMSIILDNVFTTGEDTIDWPDKNGDLHTFDISHFREFASAIGRCMTQAIKVTRNESPTLPTIPVRIA